MDIPCSVITKMRFNISLVLAGANIANAAAIPESIAIAAKSLAMSRLP